MPYEIAWEPGGAYKRFSGVVTAVEYHRSQIDVTSHERFDAIGYVINDFSAIDRLVVSDEDARYLAAYSVGPHATRPYLRVCFVTRDPAIAGLIDRSAGMSKFTLEVYASLDAARKSLGGQAGA